MDKGWGVTLENSGHLFGHKTIFGFDLSPRINHRNENNNNNNNPIMFPVNSSGVDENDDMSSDNGDRRLALGEVDFFSDKRRPSYEVSDAVKTENSHSDEEMDVNTGLQLVTVNTGSDQSTVDDGISSDAEDKKAKNKLAQLHVELERMNAENQRLKGMLTHVNNNYTALQMQLVTLMQQQKNQKNDSTHQHEIVDRKSEEKKLENGGSMVPRQFLDLARGVAIDEQSNSTSEERTISGSLHNAVEASRNKRTGREDSPESETWGPNKAHKMSPPKPIDQSAEATMRKVRVSVRARSEAPMISDGCQWRKYGQKMAKGNPCPRAYYRCTMAVGCPVRKQVQRCAEDRAILITTYEGTHNHPLPPAAMAMASTTSAAANMLLSGSMPSADGMMNPNFLARTIFPCSSNMATISASAPFPTVTLDLTQNPNPLQLQRPSNPFQVQFPGSAHSFGSIPNTNASQVFNQALYNQSKFSGLQMSQDINGAAQLVGQSSQQVHQAQEQPHPSFADTLSAATAAITADPNFTAALTAAISSIIGGNSQSNNANNNSSPNNTDVNTTSNVNKNSSFQGN